MDKELLYSSLALVCLWIGVEVAGHALGSNVIFATTYKAFQLGIGLSMMGALFAIGMKSIWNTFKRLWEELSR